MKNEELNIQIAVINHLKLQYPKALYCASAGGMRTSMGTAKKMKASGYVKGFPDIFIYEPIGDIHGMAIEMKTRKGKPTKEQKEWQIKLEERGYLSYICNGFDEAKEIIDYWYKEELADELEK
jgi:hypothetical protein